MLKNLKKQKNPTPLKIMSNSPQVEPITAAGGIVFRHEDDADEPEVLMIFRNGNWDLPKGKLEPDETIEMCAVREVAEEVGSELPVIEKKVGTTYHEYPENGKTMGKTTHWYSMTFSGIQNFTPQKNEGIKQIGWFPFSEAVEIAGFENLREILRTFIQQ